MLYIHTRSLVVFIAWPIPVDGSANQDSDHAQTQIRNCATDRGALKKEISTELKQKLQMETTRRYTSFQQTGR
jgi:hypothetical protein